MAEHPYGQPLEIITFKNGITFDEDKLNQLLLHPSVRDREVAIFSIVGSYRRGKSFLMDYCLRFMYANFKSVNNRYNAISDPENWIGSGTEPLKGFSWRSGATRDTTGITFWSDVFLYNPPLGDPMAILLVDTQGLFDPETSSEENSKILALTTLFSSTMILNLNGVIQEDILQYLQYTTEFAIFAKSSSNTQVSKPFQKFLFLIRDWQNVEEYDFGFDGGSKYLNEILKPKPNQADDLKSVREHLRDSYDKLMCFLMPYPGKKVATSSDYDGQWSLMDEDFLTELKSLITQFFKPQNIMVKKVDGVDLKAVELNSMIQGFIKTFSEPGSLPKFKSLLDLTIGKFLTQLVNESLDIFESSLTTPEISTEITFIINTARSKALLHYFDARKIGSAEDAEKYKVKLEEKMTKREEEWKEIVNSHLSKIEEEKRKAEEAEREAERIRKLDLEKKIMEQDRELKRQEEERQRELARQREELRLQEERLREEKRKQEEIEEGIRREKERQRQLEEERRRLEEERRRREEEERNRLFKVQIDEIGVNFNVPKPNCCIQ